MWMINIITEFNVVDLSCGWSIIVVLTNKFKNMLWRHQLHLLQHSWKLLNSDMLSVCRIKVLEGRLKQNSICFDDAFNVNQSLNQNMLFLISEFRLWLSVSKELLLLLFRFIKHSVYTITKRWVIYQSCWKFVFVQQRLNLFFIKLNV